MQEDTEELRVEVPLELATLLRRNRAARQRFEALAYTHRREHAQHVAGGKREETRKRRAARVVEQLSGSE